MVTISADLTKRNEFLLFILSLSAEANLNRLDETLNLLKHVLPAESNVIRDVEGQMFSNIQTNRNRKEWTCKYKTTARQCWLK